MRQVLEVIALWFAACGVPVFTAVVTEGWVAGLLVAVGLFPVLWLVWQIVKE